jgi:NADH dehydrogenase
MQINLIQSGGSILNTMSEKSSAAAEFLVNLGVKIWKNVRTLIMMVTITTNSDLVFDTRYGYLDCRVQGAV